MFKKIKSIIKGNSHNTKEKLYSLNCIDAFLPTAKSKSITFKIPDEYVNDFKWQAGQYVSLEIEMSGKKLLRDYSIYTLPNNKSFSICIKEIENGTASKYLVNNDLLNKTMRMSLPKGKFTLSLKPNEKRKIVAFAAGSGITPVYAIIQDLLLNEPESEIHLFYGNKTPETTIFRQSLEDLASKYSTRFHLYLLYTEWENSNPLFNGRMNKAKLDLFINQILEWDEVDEVLICGPNEMAVELREACITNGLHASQIHTEFFTPIEQKKKESSTFNKVKVEVILNSETYNFVWDDPSESLLDAILNKGIEVPYSCKGGVCGTCVCTLKGEAVMGEQLCLVESEIEEGKFLPCVCYDAKTNISTNFDDV